MSVAPALASEEQVVVFRIQSERYAIDIFRVSEIIRLREITPIPGSALHIRGLVNLRGKTIPVINLRTRFGLPEAEDADATRIIVIEGEHGLVGIVVDEVCEVLTLGEEAKESKPPLIADEHTEFVRGVARSKDQLITLLDLDKALVA